MSFALIYAIFVTGLNLFMGYAGQVTLRPQRVRGAQRLRLGGVDHGLWLAAARPPSRPAWRSRSAGALLIGYPTLAAQGPLSRHGDAGDRAHRLRGRGAMAGGDRRLYGHFRHSADRHRRLRDRLRSRAARLPVADGRADDLERHAPALVALRPRAGGDRRQRGRSARAGHRRRALQAHGLSHLGRLCGARRIAVRARGRVRQSRGLRPAHGRAGLHHALCRRHRHRRRPADRRGDHQPAARDLPRAQGLSGPRLRRGADPAADLRAQGSRRARRPAAARARRDDACLRSST